MFLLGIEVVRDELGFSRFELDSSRDGVREELVLTFVRNWLQDTENKYHENFKTKFSL